LRRRSWKTLKQKILETSKKKKERILAHSSDQCIKVLKAKQAGRQWLTPVTLATQETHQEDCSLKPA
jgi:hypothetical protein